IMDGRWHPQCRHFISMSTRFQDCMKPNCVFSSRHEHGSGGKSPTCIRMMQLPVKNPIRISPALCADCAIIDAELRRGPDDELTARRRD
ncbi:hypothetical protein PUNSTDRAFT_71198, partial [Punctularia strigosozonata HHB-11173 SS5]|uniref:uncharacterized protein n=1 Tax=Punctularia strigosozonata (strain HHB-11173) TaxID=741275 RepID=UPI0004416314